MSQLDIRHIRIVDTPIEDNKDEGLLYRENGRFFKVLAEHPSMKPLPIGCRDIEAAHMILPDRPLLLFIPVAEAQEIYSQKIQSVFKRKT